MAAKVKKEAKAPEAKQPTERITLRPIRRKIVQMRIVGSSPLIQHAWSDRNKEMMRAKHAGEKSKDRSARNPQTEGEDAAYRKRDGRYALPAMAVKAAVINAAHKDLGIEKTRVCKSLFIICDHDKLIPMDCDQPVIQEDVIRVASGGADLRYRPYFFKWSCVIKWEVDTELLSVSDLVTLVDRAGFGVGLLDWRPERGGEYGRFYVDKDFGVKVQDR